MLDRHAARAHDLESSDIDAVIRLRRAAALTTACACPDHLRRVVLGALLPTRIQLRGEQLPLPAEQRLDTLHQGWPLRPRHLEMPPEIEQRTLAHACTFANRFN